MMLAGCLLYYLWHSLDALINKPFFKRLTTKLCGANEAQRSLRPNERIVIHFFALPTVYAPLRMLIHYQLHIQTIQIRCLQTQTHL